MARIGVGGGLLIGTTLAIAWLDGGLSTFIAWSAVAGGGYVMVRRKMTRDRLAAEATAMRLDCHKCRKQVTPTIVGAR